ncbi:uncharacterized protein LOC129754802 [Uranotaenia lowii]|uniref:uncharacterized protein LOC129754802 n=1 Tax=Uranotaenia lowii TaxID=190385 RepID=UPI00247940C4|nr:uncharacterized protein LOC129754802 [Uranotaenia lowii]
MSASLFSESTQVSSNEIGRKFNVTGGSFTDVLCVSDSDETSCSVGSSEPLSNKSQHLTDSAAVIDLTILSAGTEFKSESNNTTRTNERETSGSLIEISDSGDDTLPTSYAPPCSTLRSVDSEYRLGSMAERRLDNFFDNIPDLEKDSSDVDLNKSNISRVSENRFINNAEENFETSQQDIEETQSKENDGTDDTKENIPSKIVVRGTTDGYGRQKINVSAKINIKIQVSQMESEEESEAEDCADREIFNPQAQLQPVKIKPFIDERMVELLDEIYGSTWRTSEMMKLCLPRNKTALSFSNNTVSFLESLDSKVPISECHKDAIKYRQKYNANKDELMHKLYDIFNERVFKGKLEVPLSWNKKLTNTAGRCFNLRRNGERYCRIELSDKVITSAERMRSTLIHEMCHAAAWIYDTANGHSKSWKNWTHRALAALPMLPPISVCHQYEIEYKYTYQCTLCKAKYNAHTKSKKVENIRCSNCHGKIELFLNKKDKEGSTVATPVRQAKGFALFVKERYKEFRDKQSHKDTMKELGLQFACLSTEDKNKYA